MGAASKLVRFGLFELDLGEGVLRKNGRLIALQNQPFRILEVLLEHRGQTVTREQLRQALWSTDTFVDFDHSLSAAVAKLRQTLRDSAENPIFIKTETKRGYRFIAPVEWPGGFNEISETSAPPDISAARPGQTKAQLDFWRSLILGAVLTAVVAGSLLVWSRRTRHPFETTVSQLTSDTGLTVDPAVSPDGKWLAYASDRADGYYLNLWIQNLKPGSLPQRLTYGENEAREPSFSPDGKRIAFSCAAERGSGICVMPSAGGAITRLAEHGSVPRFSPDGKWIAFQIGQNLTSAFTGYAMGLCYVMPSAGGVPRLIASDLKLTSNPVWAPDSDHLLVFRFSPTLADRDWYLTSKSGGHSSRTGLFAVLESYGLSLDSNRIPRLSEWRQGHLLFSAANGDGTNIWRMKVSDQASQQGRPERLTVGTAIETSPVLSANDDLFFESIARYDAVWSLRLDADRAVVGGDLSQLTPGPFDLLPSISTDGRFLAFSSARGRSAFSRNTQVRVLNIQANKETVLSELGMETDLHISSDGSLLADSLKSLKGRNGVRGTRVLRLEDGLSRQIPDTAKSWAFSHDNRRLLVTNDDAVIRSVDIRSGAEVFRFDHPKHTLYQASFAPGDRFIAIESLAAVNNDRRIFIVPIDNNVPKRPEEWIAIDHSSSWDDKPRWSPDGSLLYFLSDRDGRLCLWAQHLVPDTKHPIGKPFPITHLHSSRFDLHNAGLGLLEIGIARDKAVFGIAELRSNVWSIRHSH